MAEHPSARKPGARPAGPGTEPRALRVAARALVPGGCRFPRLQSQWACGLDDDLHRVRRDDARRQWGEQFRQVDEEPDPEQRQRQGIGQQLVVEVDARQHRDVAARERSGGPLAARRLRLRCRSGRRGRRGRARLAPRRRASCPRSSSKLDPPAEPGPQTGGAERGVHGRHGPGADAHVVAPHLPPLGRRVDGPGRRANRSSGRSSVLTPPPSALLRAPPQRPRVSFLTSCRVRVSRFQGACSQSQA